MSEVRAHPTQDRSRAAVRRVLFAANGEFAEHGFHAAQITRIADRADVSVGSLYRFFPDKEAIAKELSVAYLDAAAKAFAPVLDAIGNMADVEAAVSELVRVAADLHEDHAGYYRLTSDVHPSDERSWAYPVRQALVQAFDDKLDAIGHPMPSAERIAIIDFAIETTRSTLAMVPATGVRRASQLAELDVMVTTYLRTRLDLASRSPSGRRS